MVRVMMALGLLLLPIKVSPQLCRVFLARKEAVPLPCPRQEGGHRTQEGDDHSQWHLCLNDRRVRVDVKKAPVACSAINSCL